MRPPQRDRLHGEADEPAGRSGALVGASLLVAFGAVFAFGVWVGQARAASQRRMDEDLLARLDGVGVRGSSKAAEPVVFHEALAVPSPPSADQHASIAPVRTHHVEAPHARVTAPAAPPEEDPAVRHDAPALRPPAPPERDPAPAGEEGVFTLHVASYDQRADADRFADRMRHAGHRAFVVRTSVVDRGTLYRVRVGPFDSLAAAQRYRLAFEQQMSIPTFIVRRELADDVAPAPRRNPPRASAQPQGAT